MKVRNHEDQEPLKKSCDKRTRHRKHIEGVVYNEKEKGSKH